MSNNNNNITPYDWFNRFFDLGVRRRSGSGSGSGGISNIGGLFGRRDIFRDFEDMEQEMDRMFNVLHDVTTNAPKELIREYQTSDGAKVREVGPLVYGYSMTIGPDGKPQVREFGNVKPNARNSIGGYAGTIGSKSSPISSEREPLVDVNMTDKGVKVVLEIPGVKKEDIKINAYDEAVEVIANNPQRKYHKTIELPHDVDTQTAKSSYNNGILEITFNKRKETKPKGKEIKIE